MPTDRHTTARAASDALRTAQERVRALHLVVGFDAVVDSIIDVVETREGDGYTRIDAIERLAARIGAAAGHSANLEFVVTQRKVGGNACNLAASAVALGAGVTLMANTSDERQSSLPHPVLAPLTDACRQSIALGPPAATDALEFSDGKLMLGKTEALDAISWEGVLEATGGAGPFAAALSGCDALVTANWTMTSAMNDIWRRLATVALPVMDVADRPKRLFVDLADPAKRTDTDLQEGLDALRALNALTPVALGLNLAEATRVARLAGAPAPNATAMTDASALAQGAAPLREALGLDTVVLHSRFCAASASVAGQCAFEGPFTRTPALSTGAGDNFNAGWLLADRLDLPPEQCLAVGSAVAGWYVRKGASPTLEELCAFLSDLPAPERP